METEQTEIDILSLSQEELAREILAMGEKTFRAKQIYEWLHVKKISDFSQMSNISIQLRERLSKKFCIKSLKIKKRLVSDLDNTVKYLYGLPDGQAVETVLMEYKHGNSLCISTQVGCKMGCRFCASAIAGFVRNLEPSEMLLQIYETERDSGRRVDSIVLMGIGEPLDNFDNVKAFMETVSSPYGFAFGSRHITLSTCGIVPNIKRLDEIRCGFNLAISLHSADSETRSALMPVNRRWDLSELMETVREYSRKNGQRIAFEYILIDGVNDGAEQAEKLASLTEGISCFVNLIPYNQTEGSEYRRSENADAFFDALKKRGVNAIFRREFGGSIKAACGQLAAEAE